VNGKKFVFRINMDTKNKTKSRKEFNSLKIAEKYGIGPKAKFIDDSRKIFDTDLIIISYIEGKTVNKTKDYLKPKMYKKIGRLCSKLHAIKINKQLKKLDYNETFYGYTNHIRFIKKEYIKYLNLKIKDKVLLRIINETFLKQSKEVPKKKYETDIILSQGDFCEQNVIVCNKEYKLIDFEDLELADRANHLAHIFSDFGRPLNEVEKELFLKEYMKRIKVDKKELTKKIDVWVPLKFFEIFLWSLKHTLVIREGKMHPQFYKNDDMRENISYVKTMFKRCLRFGVIDKKYSGFNIEKPLN
jgi:tRNA A-37 threonylcarbamoyl transferase component Bud32